MSNILPTYYKRVEALSYLPDAVLRFLSKRFDDPTAFELGIDEPGVGTSYFMDASYHKWCRTDEKAQR